jgi:curved DNA-binding protein CbpA
MAKDPYATLGVARNAGEKDIKSAYRKLAKELHPDTNKDNPQAAERFSDVTAAYDLLSDKDKRARFDRGEIDGDGNPAYGGFGGGAVRAMAVSAPRISAASAVSARARKVSIWAACSTGCSADVAVSAAALAAERSSVRRRAAAIWPIAWPSRCPMPRWAPASG